MLLRLTFIPFLLCVTRGIEIRIRFVARPKRREEHRTQANPPLVLSAEQERLKLAARQFPASGDGAAGQADLPCRMFPGASSEPARPRAPCPGAQRGGCPGLPTRPGPRPSPSAAPRQLPETGEFGLQAPQGQCQGSAQTSWSSRKGPGLATAVNRLPLKVTSSGSSSAARGSCNHFSGL